MHEGQPDGDRRKRAGEKMLGIAGVVVLDVQEAASELEVRTESPLAFGDVPCRPGANARSGE
jgi:hypothetical protein